MESDEKKLPFFTPFHLIPTSSPEKRLQQPTSTLDLFTLPKRSSYQFESSFYNDDDNSSSLPPTYDSIFAQFKEEKETKANSFQHLKTVLTMFAGQIGCTLSLMLLLALPLSMIVVGVNYKDLCPVEPFIPIYLIVGGSFGIVKMVSIIIQRTAYNGDIFQDEKVGEDERPIAWMFIDGVLNLFLFTWFVAGNIWVYSKYKPNYVPPPHQPFNYCNKTVYIFAFWVITTSYIILSMICFCTCCLALCASCTAFFLTSANAAAAAEREAEQKEFE